ncbi:MAG TPA: Gfo/Idh/MocA family oxidoreductase [Acidimicrobiales bacterium]|nr:Gfo/Idh/MocA family oxidoreductase [Acidimicrobiales bacterium]
MTQVVNIGIVGGGLMGKELAAAIGRWDALEDHPVRPRLTHVCDTNPAALDWFDKVDSVVVKTTDYRDLLKDDGVDVLYIAVPHHLHEEIYVEAITAGKDVLGEKPFGIDLDAAARIVAVAEANPDVFVRCSSEMPFFPAAQKAFDLVRSGALGRIVDAGCGFLHSSDYDLDKPINWKRQAQHCGEIGVMGDLGMHTLHLPLRLGWLPEHVYGVLQHLVDERPRSKGAVERVPCDTFENATLVCTVDDEAHGRFPLTLEQKRIAPGEKNSFYFRVRGLDGCVEFSTRYPKTLWRLKVDEGEQVWQQVEMGSQSAFPTVTGGIFEFGFSDAILQMWAAFLAERAGQLGDRFGCVTPAEALDSHRVFAAALRSHETHAACPPLDSPAR